MVDLGPFPSRSLAGVSFQSIYLPPRSPDLYGPYQVYGELRSGRRLDSRAD